MAKTSHVKIDSLIPDNRNANKGTEFGSHLIEESLRKFGGGRSILIDKNNRIIAGNKTIENASAIGMDNIIIVETDGTQIVAVKRSDVDIDSAKGRELALADNATSKVNLEWDEAVIAELAEDYALEPSEWGIDLSDIAVDIQQDDFEEEASPKLIIESPELAKLSLLFSELQDRGFKCKLVD